MIFKEEVNNIVTVTKIHSNYYYVVLNNIVLECMLRNKLKKEGIDVKVGDKVLIDEVNHENNTAVITEVLPRRNSLDKPNVANIDQIVIVISPDKPTFSPLILEKFIILTESSDITPIICVNKSDLMTDDIRDYLDKTYVSVGYKVIYTSALEKIGLEELRDALLGRVSVFSGVSGVGKSSLLNTLDSSLRLETGEVSKLLGSGTHTTRFVCLLKLFFNDKYALIADTPGFSFMEFNNIDSSQLAWYFKEFVPFIPDCQLSSCLHWKEPYCKVKDNIDTESVRYNNYLKILQDILDLEKISKARSSKKEDKFKLSKRADGKQISVVKLGSQSRESSRKVLRQELSKIEKINVLDEFNDI